MYLDLLGLPKNFTFCLFFVRREMKKLFNALINKGQDRQMDSHNDIVLANTMANSDAQASVGDKFE
jgi:hypothetical protein